jgi:hypothetical protein
VKLAPVPAIAVASLLLAGCEPALTLAEAQAACTKQGGLLVVIYSQQLTQAGLGPMVAKPGHCVSPDKFDKTWQAVPPPAAPPPATAN